MRLLPKLCEAEVQKRFSLALYGRRDVEVPFKSKLIHSIVDVKDRFAKCVWLLKQSDETRLCSFYTLGIYGTGKN